MRDPKRIRRILKKIKKIWIQYPDLRLNQLMSWINRSHNKDCFYREDDHFELLLDAIIEKYK